MKAKSRAETYGSYNIGAILGSGIVVTRGPWLRILILDSLLEAKGTIVKERTMKKGRLDD